MIFRSGSILIFRFHIVEVGSLSHYLQFFLRPRWLFGISEPSTVSQKQVDETPAILKALKVMLKPSKKGTYSKPL